MSGEVTMPGEVCSNGYPVILEQIILFSPFGIVGKEIVDCFGLVDFEPVTPPLR